MASADNQEFAHPLRESDVDPDPFRQFSAWFFEATRSGVRIPEAAALATAAPDGAPSVRMVLVKEMEREGFVFYSNYDSRKGHELGANPRAALLFYWDPLGRQVRIEGEAHPVGQAESAAYIQTRPRGSQLSALASPQSQPIPGREWLEDRVAELARAYDGREVPLPEAWGGFRLLPESLEFWQHREDRLHDRLLYTRAGKGWRIERLAP